MAASSRSSRIPPRPSGTAPEREEWSQEALESLLLQLPEVKWTQDLRDAVGAALTAKTTDLKLTGKIALPG